MASDVQVAGLSELQALLDQLPAQIERKLMRGALRAGQKVVLDQAKASIHHISGDLAKSLRISTSARGGIVKATVKAGDKKAYYAHMVEFGTAAHYIKPKSAKSLFFAGLLKEGVDHPGARKTPFMRPAMDAQASADSPAFQAVAAYLAPRITKELAKLPDEKN